MTDIDFADNDIATKYLTYSKNTQNTVGIIKFLKFCRTSKTGYPSHIAQLGSTIIDQGYGKSIDPDEYYLIMEQTCLAYLLLKNSTKAEQYVNLLSKEVGEESTRILRIRGLINESKGHIATAIDKYNETLTKNPNNAALHKRVITTYKEDGNYIDAVKHLSSYLEKFCSDTDAWLEMAELQIMLSPFPSVKNYNPVMNRIAHAVFCMEELVLLQPNNAAFHTRIADLLCRAVVENGLPSSSPSLTNNNLRVSTINGNPVTNTVTSITGQQYKAIDTKSEDYTRLLYSLRNARLHASEGVRLTQKKNLYALCTLADTCYLHFCAATKQPFSLQGRLLLGTELSSMVEVLKEYYVTLIPSSSTNDNPVNQIDNHNNSSSSSTVTSDTEEDDCDLHNLAVVEIDNLSRTLSGASVQQTLNNSVQVGGSSSSSSVASTSNTTTTDHTPVKLTNIYTALELEQLLATSKVVQQILQTQKQCMRY